MERMTKEELKELENLKDFKVYVFEGDIYVKAEDFRKKAIECRELREENKKLKEDNRFLTKISKEYMEKENIVQVTEFTELYKDELKKENEQLKEKIEKMEYGNSLVFDDVERICNEKLALKEENKKLSEENVQLKEKIETLELRLDNKEKLNEEYRKQLDGYKM